MSRTQLSRFALVSASLALVASTALVTTGCGGTAEAHSGGKKVIVLGFDGIDFDLTRKWIDEGRLPNFARLEQAGGLAPLETSMPPQSPVAWSNFITGMDSGGHGIYDFVHRDPETMLPYLSTSKTEEGDHDPLHLGGKWQLPLSSGETILLRHGTPFWDVLEENGVATTIVRMPANYPPSGTASKEISGMGTPDVLGTYGTFSFYTTELFAFAGDDVSGGEVYEVWPVDDDIEHGVIETELEGPANPFLQDKSKLEVPFEIHLDQPNQQVKLVVGDEHLVLGLREWSDWVPITFEMVPTKKLLLTLPGMVRFYLQEMGPEMKLYVSPINFDPENPATAISTPEDWAGELSEGTGRYYTQGMPEDTKAYSEGVLDRDEFLEQSELAGIELIAQYGDVLGDFLSGDHGFLFYYFGNADQTSHMLMRTMDPGHPAYDPEVEPHYADVIPGKYEELDRVVGQTLDRIGPEDLVVVMSDHGFTSWRRSFHLNAWLRDAGFLKPKNPNLENDPGYLTNVDWSGTRAYGLGINGLYVNLEGRERDGIVSEKEKDALLDEITAKLLAVIDPATGTPAVTRVYRRDTFYEDRGHLEIGPDLLIGYAKGTRGSNETAAGEISPEILTDNLDAWSGDHCMEHTTVPGVLLSNRPLAQDAPRLQDLAGALLAEFGIEGFPQKNQENG